MEGEKSGAYIIVEESFASASKSLNGKYFSLFHLLLVVVLDEGNLFTAVDMVTENIVASEIPDSFDREDLSVNFDFVALHHLLDRGANVTHPSVNTSMLRTH